MRTLLEFIAVILVIVGSINEKKLIAFEQKILFPNIKDFFKKLKTVALGRKFYRFKTRGENKCRS